MFNTEDSHTKHSLSNGADQLVNAMFVVKGWASSTDLAVREAVEDLNAARANPFQMQHVDIGKSMMVSLYCRIKNEPQIRASSEKL